MSSWRGSKEGLINQILIAADTNNSRGWDVILLLCMKTSKDSINLRNVCNYKYYLKKRKSKKAMI